MASFMKEFEHLRIRLEEVKKATNNFGNKVIGSGGFGAVYQGEVLLSKGRSITAIKRLNRQFGQGDREFLKEIMMLSRYRHQNLITLLGFCDEENEKVLVYEYAPKGSLDKYLSDPGLTWTERIHICLGAAEGLRYLHDPRGKHQRVLHCDIKSANILLDENMIAKVADFGLSKVGPAHQGHSVLVTNPFGTAGYCDPLFMRDYTLTKESDVYSFGVVLFEVFCGRLCSQHNNGKVKVFVSTWKEKFSKNKLDEIVFEHLQPQMDPKSLKLFSNIAFQCLHDSREGRPTMSTVVEKLKKALNVQLRMEAIGGVYEEMNNRNRWFTRILQTMKFKEMNKNFEEGTGTKSFSYNEISQATSGFSERNKLGEGGFGSVYKGFLRDTETYIAVKRVSAVSLQVIDEYIAEVEATSRLRHKNLVELKGWCRKKNKLLLIYEFMENGSLDLHLFKQSSWLTWDKRIRIANGLASALLYLHEGCQKCILHRDIKSSNVMLDSNFDVKLGDFVSVNLVDHEKGSQVTIVVGTRGYIAPEYASTGKASKESDVYSFGVVALEIACGRRPIEYEFQERPVILVKWVRDFYDTGNILKAIDPSLVLDNKEQIERLMIVGLWCAHPNADQRPSMKEVIQVLSYEASLPIIPSKMTSVYAAQEYFTIPTSPTDPKYFYTIPIPDSPTDPKYFYTISIPDSPTDPKFKETNIDFEEGSGPFSYDEIFQSTAGFAETNKIGEGGFGSVYKGFLRDTETYIAVKRNSKISKQGIDEYTAEVKIFSRLRHKNLVELKGWCYEKSNLLLIYEFMKNGSLDQHLFEQRSWLSWDKREKIVYGLASALFFLHEGCKECILHRDIKSSNVMLDSNFDAKLGDFGLAKVVDHKKGSKETIVVGTHGYMAPEYASTGKASKESDVYSFGVVALEIACGRRPIEYDALKRPVILVEWVRDFYETGNIFKAIDPSLGLENKDLIAHLIFVGLWCAHPLPDERPSMEQAIQVLNYDVPPSQLSKLPSMPEIISYGPPGR